MDKLQERDSEKKNKYMCTCHDPTVPLSDGKPVHATGCLRADWARNSAIELKPPAGLLVQMMPCAGTKAGAWYKFNGKKKWYETTPPAAPQ